MPRAAWRGWICAGSPGPTKCAMGQRSGATGPRMIFHPEVVSLCDFLSEESPKSCVINFLGKLMEQWLVCGEVRWGLFSGL